MSDPAPPHAHYEQTPDGIHRFTLHRDTRQAVDIVMDVMSRIVPQHPPDQWFMLLVDLRASGMPPVAYATQRSRALYAEHQQPPKLRVAYLHSMGAPMAFATALLQLLRLNVERRYFHEDLAGAERFLLGGK